MSKYVALRSLCLNDHFVSPGTVINLPAARGKFLVNSGALKDIGATEESLDEMTDEEKKAAKKAESERKKAEREAKKAAAYDAAKKAAEATGGTVIPLPEDTPGETPDETEDGIDGTDGADVSSEDPKKTDGGSE